MSHTKNCLRKKTAAVTLIEVLVAFFIFILIAGVLYKVIKYMGHTRALGEARSMAQREVGFVVGMLQKEFSQATLNSFQNPDGTHISVKVNDGNHREDLKFVYNPPKLTRKFKGKAHFVAKNLVKLIVDKIASGQLLIEAKSSVYIDGMRPDEAQTFTQNQMVVMREDMASANDPHWRDIGNVSGVFDSQQDLINGLEEDALAVIEDIGDEASALANDIRNATQEKIDEIKGKLIGSIRRIKDKLNELDSQISDMHWRAIIGNWGIGNIGYLYSTPRQMKNLLTGMRTASSLNWRGIVNTAHVRGFSVKDSFHSMYKAKEDLFKAGRDIVDIGNRLNLNLSQEIDTSMFY